MDNKLVTCCFTGHRPNSLPWGNKESSKGGKLFKKNLQKVVITAIDKGYLFFISGMAMGIDIIAAELVLKLKKKHPNIKLECALPCLNQTRLWKDEKYLKRYKKIIDKADSVTYVSNTNYFNGCMQKRNKYMVDESSLLLAFFNGQGGGTKSTIDYAKSKNLEIINIFN